MDIQRTVTSMQELMSQRGVLRGPMYAQHPILIEDALGWTFQIPLEIARSWDVS